MSKMQRKPPNFYSRPCGRGDDLRPVFFRRAKYFYSRPCGRGDGDRRRYPEPHVNFYSRPCGRGDSKPSPAARPRKYFYSRPCGRGDRAVLKSVTKYTISTHAPAGGATLSGYSCRPDRASNFYSRPCGRGDAINGEPLSSATAFLLTPLREGRPGAWQSNGTRRKFLLTPLREGRHLRYSCPG